ncbi:MAG TPA: helix-turn-helix domain-containing protein [Nitrososphaeraceae archaeon]|nr:helix-turn-helix domain-containing protein [Nitrososphaeraceae archaeon]
MPRYIPPDDKLSVIEDWLYGETREDIARKHNIGSGTVYNYVHEWSNKLGIEKAEVLRELAIQLKKNGLTVNDCAKGFRIVTIFKKYGLKEEDEAADRVTYFLKEIYLKCQEANLPVQKVFLYIYDIINFSKEISISQIPQFLKEKKEEKERLEASIQNLNQKINELENVEKEKRQEIQRLSGITKKLSRNYSLFSIIKYKLGQYGISMENLDQFVDCVVGIAKENYNVTKVLELIGDYENLLSYIQLYKKEVEAKKDELNQLNQEINYRKGVLDSYRIKLDVIGELERMGFGINELRILYDTLMEIGRENINNTNNKTFEQIKKEFFEDLKNYDEILGSRKEKDRLQNEIKNLEMQLIKEKERYNAYPKVIESIERLSNAGIYENDILAIDKIVSMAGISHNLYKDKHRYKQTLIDDLQKYGNLKLAIKKLKDRKIVKPKKKKTRYKTRSKKSSSSIKDDS